MDGTAAVVNVNDVLDGHVALEVECVDRLLLNAYVPNLQVGGQVVRLITRHLGKPIPSAAALGGIGNCFRREVSRFAEAHQVPILKLKTPDRSRWDDRKLDHVRPYLQAAERERRFGVDASVNAAELFTPARDDERASPLACLTRPLGRPAGVPANGRQARSWKRMRAVRILAGVTLSRHPFRHSSPRVPESKGNRSYPPTSAPERGRSAPSEVPANRHVPMPKSHPGGRGFESP
jgi:hypothetical protein